MGIFWSTPHSSDAQTVDAATNSTQDTHPERAAIAFPGMALCFVLFAAMYRHSARLRFRAGSGLWGGLFRERGSAQPTSLMQLKQNMVDARIEGRPYTMVGAGWSNTLGQRTATGRRMYMHLMSGRLNERDRRTWLAGTTLKTVRTRWPGRTCR